MLLGLNTEAFEKFLCAITRGKCLLSMGKKAVRGQRV